MKRFTLAFKKRVFEVLSNLGIKVSRRPIKINGIWVDCEYLKNHKWVEKYNFKTIIDVGANTGQFASKFRIIFPNSRIISFEPIPEVYHQLKNKFQGDLNFEAINLALGKDSGIFDFHQNEFSDTSSLLPMKNLLHQNFPHTIKEKLIKVNIERLDDVVENLTIDKPLLIKIDVQGFEEMVILGGEETIKKAIVVIVEVSFIELYENQIFFNTIYDNMTRLGFSYRGNYEQLISPIDGCILQADAIFVKEDV